MPHLSFRGPMCPLNRRWQLQPRPGSSVQVGSAHVQAVTGRSTSIPVTGTACLRQFKINEDLEKDEALRRAERIRASAACHWIDSHEGLRRALNAKSRPPHLETLREGSVVYCYDPPTNWRGLARRLQDNSSWSGPAVVVSVERTEGAPKRVWVRMKTWVKCYPLEELRLATCDEMVSAEYISGALKDVQEELNKGTLKIREDKQGSEAGTLPPIPEDEPRDPPDAQMEGQESSSSSEASSTETAEDIKMERAAKRKELLTDVPQAMRPKKVKEPHELSFDHKRKLFEKLAKDLQTPTPMEEAKVRAKMEKFDQLKKVRKTYRKEDKAQARAEASTARSRKTRAAYVTLPEELETEINKDGGVDGLWSEVEDQATLWDNDIASALCVDNVKEIVEAAEKNSSESARSAYEAKLVTGKQRLEYKWQNLSPEWKEAFEKPILKALQVYFDHNAVSGVSKDAVVDPRKVLSSRFVLTNKGKENLRGRAQRPMDLCRAQRQ